MLPDPTPARPRRLRRTALGLTGATVLAVGLIGGGEAAFATAGVTTFSQLASDFTSGVDSSSLGADLSGGTLVLGPNSGSAGATTLDLNGHSLTVQSIQLESNQAGTMTGASLIVTGTGTLTVTQTSSSLAAIEVDSASSLTVLGGVVTASVPSGSTAAAIGGGPSMGSGLPQTSGAITFNGGANVTAVGGSAGGAAIGGGQGATAGQTITFGGHSVVSASAGGGGAAIGDGSGAAAAAIVVANSAQVSATHVGSGATGAAIGGGASPSGQTAGSVTIGDDSVVTATAAGKGAAIGGGYHGDGGSIAINGYSVVSATANASTGEAGIGDGDTATNGGTTVTIAQNAEVTAAGGGAGGAGIGGGSGAYGNGSVTISGATIVAASSVNGPGIGGQRNRNSLPVSIGGTAQVTAVGGGNGAAIGGGDSYSGAFPSVGAQVSVGAGAQLSLSAASGTSTLGAGTGVDFGAFSNAGTVTLASGKTLVIPSSASFSNAGTFVNDGTISGTGTFGNGGTLLQNGTLSAPVSGNAYKLIYDGVGVGTPTPATQLVYAQRLSDAGIGLATVSQSGAALTGWNTSSDGTGSAITTTTDLSTLNGSATGSPVVTTAYALYQLAPVLPSTGSLLQGVVGTSYGASVSATTGTAPIVYSRTSGSFPPGLGLNSATGAITGTPTTVGTFTFTVQATNQYTSSYGQPVAHDYTIQIVMPPITLSVPRTAKGSTRYLAGSTATVTVGGLQANESYAVSIGGKTVYTGKAASNSSFTKKVTVPKTISDGSQTVRVTGASHANAATATILTASVSKSLGLKLSAKKVKAKKKVVITVSRLYAGESVRVVIKGKHGKTAVGSAKSNGTYVVTLKSGLVKGSYTVTVTGANTGRTAKAKLVVT